MTVRGGVTRRGTSNSNERGSAEDRRRRKEWLLVIYAANVKMHRITYRDLEGEVETALIEGDTLPIWAYFPNIEVIETVELATCRCYRCGRLLCFETLTVDRIVPGCKGGSYRRTNIRPACGDCNSETGAPLANGKEHQPAKKAARKRVARKRAAKKVLVPT